MNNYRQFVFFSHIMTTNRPWIFHELFSTTDLHEFPRIIIQHRDTKTQSILSRISEFENWWAPNNSIIRKFVRNLKSRTSEFENLWAPNNSIIRQFVRNLKSRIRELENWWAPNNSIIRQFVRRLLFIFSEQQGTPTEMIWREVQKPISFFKTCGRWWVKNYCLDEECLIPFCYLCAVKMTWRTGDEETISLTTWQLESWKQYLNY